eukprot:s4327_g5.t1
MYDWISMERHITEGRCVRLKIAAAEGKDIEHVLKQVEEEEAKSPPEPPDSNRVLVTNLDRVPDELLDCELHQLPTKVKLIEKYKMQCALCAQQIKATGHVKTHWQTTHKPAWDGTTGRHVGCEKSKGDIKRPCQYCGSTAKHGSTDSTHHATKCAPPFQVLAVRRLHRDGTLEQHFHSRRGPALKQREKEPQYKALERTGIQALLSSTSQQSGKPAATSGKSPPMPPVTPNRSNPDMREQPADLLGTLRVRLRNPHNLCYLNAGVLAMMHAMQGSDMPRGLRQVKEVIAFSHRECVNLSLHFGLRQLFSGWTLDARQKDVAEFTGFILDKVGHPQAIWEARESGREGHIVTDAGCGMIYLELPESDCDLQELMSAWSYQAQTHALVTKPEHFMIQLGRFPHRGKSHAQVRFQQQVRVPIFREGIECMWCDYTVAAGSVHYGDSPHSGHYRSVLRVQDQWWIKVM